MSTLISIIGKYSAKLSIIPILTLILIAITLIIDHYVKRKKIYKYLPSLVLLGLAIIIGIYSLGIFTTDRGLNIARLAILLGTPSLIGIFLCFIIDLVKSIKRNTGDLERVGRNGKK